MKNIIILCILVFFNFLYVPSSYLESGVLISSLTPNEAEANAKKVNVI